MIEALQEIKQEHGGELECVDEDAISLAYPEFNNDDPGNPCVIMCEKR
jgi:hypothetical protein